MSNRYRYYQLCIWPLINVEPRYHSNRVFSTIGLIVYYQLLEISSKVMLLSTVHTIELLNKYGLSHHLKRPVASMCQRFSKLFTLIQAKQFPSSTTAKSRVTTDNFLISNTMNTFISISIHWPWPVWDIFNVTATFVGYFSPTFRSRHFTFC